MLEEIRKLVKESCQKKTNIFGYGAWSHHITSVVKYAKLLAKKLKADKEILEIAALLHDYAGIKKKGWYPKHHIHSARLAEEILKKYNYPIARIEKVKQCILTHRASKNITRKSIEAEILAAADYMAHFDNVHSLLYLAFVQHRMKIDRGKRWVLAKLKRDWDRLKLPEAKEIIRDKYEAIRKALSNNQ